MHAVPVCSELILVGHLLLTINSSVNFLVYTLGNSRKVLRTLCLCKNLDRSRDWREHSPFADPPTSSTHFSETSMVSHYWSERRETSFIVTRNIIGSKSDVRQEGRGRSLSERRARSDHVMNKDHLQVPRRSFRI